MDYRLVLSNLKIVELQFLVTADNDLTLSRWRPLSYRNQSANQWTGFYMITTSVMKELSCHVKFPEITREQKIFFDL